MTKYVLHVYRAASGQLSGRGFDGDEEVCGVDGCATVDEVRQAVEDTGKRVDEVVDETGQYVLYVNRLPDGEVFGRLFNGEREVHCFIAGSVEEAKQAMIGAGHRVDFVVDGVTGEGL